MDFRIEGVEPQRFAATPSLSFKLGIAEAARAAPSLVHAVVLRCQIQIEPTRRRYSPAEQNKLRDLFGTPDRWGQTLRAMLWTNASVMVPSFTGSTTVDLPVPCSFDFCLAATKYFDALNQGDIPLRFLFSGTIFYEAEDWALQVGQIPWEKEADFRLPAATWKSLMELYYPNSAWLCLRKDVFDRLGEYRNHSGLATWEQVLERLLAGAEETVQA